MGERERRDFGRGGRRRSDGRLGAIFLVKKKGNGGCCLKGQREDKHKKVQESCYYYHLKIFLLLSRDAGDRRAPVRVIHMGEEKDVQGRHDIYHNTTRSPHRRRLALSLPELLQQLVVLPQQAVGFRLVLLSLLGELLDGRFEVLDVVLKLGDHLGDLPLA